MTGPTRGHLWTQTSGCPLLHPGPTACTTTGWTRGMSGLRRVSIHSSILVLPLHRTGWTRGHLWTQTSGCPLLHPGPTACTTTGQTRGMSGLRQVGVHSSILVLQLAPLLVGPGACLDSDE